MTIQYLWKRFENVCHFTPKVLQRRRESDQSSLSPTIFFCNFFGWIFNFFLSSSWLSSLRNYTSNHVSRSFFLRFLFHCRYSKCMCSSMKWLVQLPWNIVSAKVFFFVDSNAFRRNIKQVMSMNSKNHSINNRKNGWGKWWLITFASSL